PMHTPRFLLSLPDALPISDNKGRNTYYFLPFLLGLIGLIYQLNRDQRNFSIVMWLFIMTGIALAFYFNTSPGEPRERDYVYAGSDRKSTRLNSSHVSISYA